MKFDIIQLRLLERYTLRVQSYNNFFVYANFAKIFSENCARACVCKKKVVYLQPILYVCENQKT